MIPALILLYFVAGTVVALSRAARIQWRVSSFLDSISCGPEQRRGSKIRFFCGVALIWPIFLYLWREQAAHSKASPGFAENHGMDSSESAPKKIMACARKPRHCPSCGHRPVATILYGDPAECPTLERRHEAGLIVYGGIPWPNPPKWQCSKCGQKIHLKTETSESRVLPEEQMGNIDDLEAAWKWHLKSAALGSAESQYLLGDFYSRGERVPQSDVEAVNWYREAAVQGFAKAQTELGFCYHEGKGVHQDDVEAVKWYRRAAEQGHAEAQYNLGCAYAYGEGVSQDEVEAVKWYLIAAGQGFVQAQYNLGACYEFGKGVPQNEVEAVRWYLKAAGQGFAEAQFRLGICYGAGKGVPQDHVEAVKWYRKAAEQGHAEAQTSVGVCYMLGDGVPQDDVEAVKWFNKRAGKA